LTALEEEARKETIKAFDPYAHVNNGKAFLKLEMTMTLKCSEHIARE
jgi:hypothetical protein